MNYFIKPQSDEYHIEQKTVTLWTDQPSDRFLYAAAQLLNEEQDNQMITDEVPETLLQMP